MSKSAQFMSTLRVVFPQWQGGESHNIHSFCKELEYNDAAQGYSLGAQLLDFLAPECAHKITIPIEMDLSDVETVNGIYARAPLLRQHLLASKMITDEKPERIVTLGGECSVSVVPFKYLVNKYNDDYAIVWLDAHPDMGEPGDPYTGYHAMALALVLGKGDKEFIDSAPGIADPKRAVIVGVRQDPNNIAFERIPKYGLSTISVEDVRNDNQILNKFLDSIKAKHIIIHLDLDVIDPLDFHCAVGPEPNGFLTNEVIDIINELNNKYDIVGLTIAEHMPRVEIRMRNLLRSLPHIGN